MGITPIQYGNPGIDIAWLRVKSAFHPEIYQSSS